MKQRSEKDTHSLSTLPELSQQKHSTVLADAQVILAKRQLEYERCQLQLKRSNMKRDNSMHAVTKSLSVVNDFYQSYYSDAVLPLDDSEWDSFPQEAA